MKKIVNNLLIIFGAATMFMACEKDEIRAVLNADAVPTVNLSAPSVVLSKDNESNDVLTVSWQQPDFGYAAGATYTLLIDKKGNGFAAPISVAMGTGLSKVFKNDELNKLLLGLGLEAGAAADLDIKVQAKLSDSVVLTSPLAGLNATSYLDRLDLSTPWGIVGSAFNNWGATPDAPFYKTANPNIVVAYVTLLDGEMKIRQNNDWAVNYGDNGKDGILDNGGDNIVVKAGTYKITFNTSTLAYTSELFSWGIVGSAFNDWGATPDGKLMYDPSSDQWRGIFKLKAGEMKIRKNNDWATNFGDTGKDGVLDNAGDNIATTAGWYLITVNFNDNSYSVEKTDVWGIVGDATPNGWGDGPDTKFRPDYGNDGVWVLNGIVLKAGEMKFRQNDDWGVNYGDNGNNGSLEAGGDNIKVAAGTYNFVLDFSNPSSPKYTFEKL